MIDHPRIIPDIYVQLGSSLLNKVGFNGELSQKLTVHEQSRHQHRICQLNKGCFQQLLCRHCLTCLIGLRFDHFSLGHLSYCY